MPDVPNLQDVQKTMDSWCQGLKLVNVDDVFRELLRRNIDAVRITREEMAVIVTFIVANVCAQEHGTAQEKNQLKSTGAKMSSVVNQFKLLREGTVDKFFGVTLHCI